MPITVSVSTPSRLHFGLLRLAARDGPSFGGLGMMIDRPRAHVELSAANRWIVEGAAAERAQAVAERALAAVVGDKPTALHVRVIASVPLHRGLGGGTQLALAIAAGVRSLVGAPPGDAAALARAAGRGERSAIGSHGFVHGGLIWELGRRPNEFIAPMAERVEMPQHWRVLIVTPRDDHGLSGQHERDAFEALAPIPEAATQRLASLAEDQILPAARSGDFDAFGEGLYQYGRLSGEQFAAVQGGAFASDAIAECIAAFRTAGVRGVGQSSWGPTVYAVVADQDRANALAQLFARQPATSGMQLQIVACDNRGAVITSR